MRLMILIILFSLLYLVSGKNNVKALTESMGQEIIEIGTPIKELPMGIEEEPSAEMDDDDKTLVKATSNTPVSTTKKNTKKTTALPSIKNNMKDIDKIDGLNQEDEDARIEKELAEIYKDTADYKTDSAEEKDVAKQAPIEQSTGVATSAEESDKPIGRQKNNFKFEPDTTDKASVEKFRTSIDEINCDNQKKNTGTAAAVFPNSAFYTINNDVTLITAVLCFIFLCTSLVNYNLLI